MHIIKLLKASADTSTTIKSLYIVILFQENLLKYFKGFLNLNCIFKFFKSQLMLTKKINFATASNILIKRKNNIFKRPNNIFLWNTIKLFKRPNNIFYGTQLNCLSAQIILSHYFCILFVTVSINFVVVDKCIWNLINASNVQFFEAKCVVIFSLYDSQA